MEENIDVDMVTFNQSDEEHQVPQVLGDPNPEKLAGVVKKYWQYKPEMISVTKSLNEKFLVSSNCDKICAPRLNIVHG